MTAPAYQDLRADENAIETRDGATVRVIAGELFGLTGPGRTRTPISYAHVTMDSRRVGVDRAAAGPRRARRTR